MTDSQTNRVGVKIAKSAYDQLKMKRNDLFTETGHEPAIAELLELAVQSFVAEKSLHQITQGVALATSSPANASAHALIDELIAKRPRTAENMLATIRAMLKEEPVEPKVVPASPAQTARPAKKLSSK